MEPVVNHTDAEEQGARHKSVGQHDHQRAFNALTIKGEQPDGHKGHVRDRRIGDQLLHILLHERDERGVDHSDHRHAKDQPDQLSRGFGEHGEREADKAIAPHFQQHARQNDRPCGRSLNVRIRQPRMHGPHRHLHGKGREEGQEQPRLRLYGEVILHQRRNIGGARFARHPQHRDEHQQGTEQRIEEELIARLDPVRPAPDADDEIHGDQAGFEEDVEQEHILR